MTDLPTRCEAAGAGEQRALLEEAGRELYGVSSAFNWPRFTTMLDAEAYLSAAEMLVPEGWTDVRNYHRKMSDGSLHAYAEIGFDHLDMCLTAEGRAATPALALAAASLRAKGENNAD